MDLDGDLTEHINGGDFIRARGLSIILEEINHGH